LKLKLCQAQWLISVILDTVGVEIGRISVQSQLGLKISENPSQQIVAIIPDIIPEGSVSRIISIQDY
jgi:hypothetical protein